MNTGSDVDSMTSSGKLCSMSVQQPHGMHSYQQWKEMSLGQTVHASTLTTGTIASRHWLHSSTGESSTASLNSIR